MVLDEWEKGTQPPRTYYTGTVEVMVFEILQRLTVTPAFTCLSMPNETFHRPTNEVALADAIIFFGDGSAPRSHFARVTTTN
jgi:hypothetical protein